MTGISSDVYSSTTQPASSAAGTQRTQNTAGAAGASGAEGTASSKQVTKGLGKTVGNVSLSEEGAAYYQKLKEKFKGMNFVLVSEDMKDQVQANAGAYGSANGMTVLVDVDKIERMAKDEEYRAKYEGIISQASSNLKQLSAGLSQSGGSSNGVVGYGATINDNGTASYFAVIDKSLAAQQERISEKRAEKKAEAKEAEKKAAKQAQQERLEERRGGGKDGDIHSAVQARRMNEGGWEKGNAYLAGGRDAVQTSDPKNQITVQADSIEALLQKISDTVQNIRVDSVRTPQEQALGGSIDFRG